MLHRRAAYFLCIGLMSATSASAAQGVVEAIGEAQIKGGDKVTAKKAATSDGLKKCIERRINKNSQVLPLKP